MTVHRQKSVWILPIAVGLVLLSTNAPTQAASLVLKDEEHIQGLRFCYKRSKVFKPFILKYLSPQGQEILFQEPTLPIKVALVESDGSWRWWDLKGKEKERKIGWKSDLPLLQMLVDLPLLQMLVKEHKSGEVPGTQLVIPENIPRALVVCLPLGAAHIRTGGSLEHRVEEFCPQLLDAGTGLWESSDPLEPIRAELFRRLPSNDRLTLLIYPKQQRTTTDWILSKSSKDIFILPTESANNVWLKEGTVEIFLEGTDLPRKISRAQGDWHLEKLASQFSPRN